MAIFLRGDIAAPRIERYVRPWATPKLSPKVGSFDPADCVCHVLSAKRTADIFWGPICFDFSRLLKRWEKAYSECGIVWPLLRM